MLGLSPAQIRTYASKGLLDPERGTRGELRFGFRDLILLRTAGELAAARVPLRRLRRALERLREQLPEGSSLTGLRITAEGERLVVSDGGSRWNPDSGQVLFDFSTSDMLDDEPSLSTLGRVERTADEWYEVAYELESESAEEAIEAYRRVIELVPGHADAHVNIGRLLHEQGAPALAEQHYLAALDADRQHVTAAFNLGVALEDLGRTDEAAEAYRLALKIDPDYADAHFNLAGLLERRGDRRSAFIHLKAYRSLAE